MNRSPKDFYPIPLELKGLEPGALNRRRVDEGVEVVAIAGPEGLKVVRDLCPHMGGPISAGRYCAEDGTLHCPWHGYVFNVADGRMLRNPNDEMFCKLKGLYASYKPEKTPQYRLQTLSCEIEAGLAYVHRSGGR